MVVSFGFVDVRVYNVILGNNPECRFGPPIELGWEYRPVHPDCGGAVVLSDYERERSKQREGRKVRPRYLPRVYREKLLESVATEKEVKDAMREKSEARKRRRLTNRLRAPGSRFLAKFLSERRGWKIRRAVRNLKKAGIGGNIYRGWWLPLSAYLF